MAITAFLSRSHGLLNKEPGSLYRTWSPTGLFSNWLNFLCTELYNSSTSTIFLCASQIALIQPVNGQGYSSTGCTCYLHRCIFYFDSLAWVNMLHRLALTFLLDNKGFLANIFDIILFIYLFIYFSLLGIILRDRIFPSLSLNTYAKVVVGGFCFEKQQYLSVCHF